MRSWIGAPVIAVLIAGLASAAPSFADDCTPPSVCASTKITELKCGCDERLVDVGLRFEIADDQDANPSWTIAVYSNTPERCEYSWRGKRVTSPDAVLDAEQRLFLRAECDEDSCGRAYLVVIRAWDAAGNTTIKCLPVVVLIRKNHSNCWDKDNKDNQCVWQIANLACQVGQFDCLPVGFVMVGQNPCPPKS